MAKTPERAFELMEAVWPAALARVQEEVADMQAIADAGGRRHHDRAVGLPLLRGEGPQGEVRPRLRRGQAVPAARQAARGDVLRGRRAVQLRVHAGAGGLGSRVPRGRRGLGGHGQDLRATTSACGISTPTRGPASARAPGPPPTAATRRSTARRRCSARTTRTSSRARRASRPDLLGRRRDAVPRVRPRAALPLVDRRLSDAQRRCAGLHGVPVAAAGALAADRR